jgi:hypothetical protein
LSRCEAVVEVDPAHAVLGLPPGDQVIHGVRQPASSMYLYMFLLGIYVFISCVCVLTFDTLAFDMET